MSSVKDMTPDLLYSRHTSCPFRLHIVCLFNKYIMTEFKPTYLYIKQHNVTGLKYFGKTTRNPVKYKGSGLRWVRHLKQHGNNVTTLWHQLFTDVDAIKEYALHFSLVNNIVESDEWANLKPEDGLEGGSKKGRILSEETRRRLSIAGKTRKQTDATKQKISNAHTGKTRLPFSDEWKTNLSNNHRSKKGYVQSVSKETKQKISDTLSVPVYCITNDTWYKSSKAAAAALNLNRVGIGHCLIGLQKTTGGFKFARKKCDDLPD